MQIFLCLGTLLFQLFSFRILLPLVRLKPDWGKMQIHSSLLGMYKWIWIPESTPYSCTSKRGSSVRLTHKLLSSLQTLWESSKASVKDSIRWRIATLSSPSRRQLSTPFHIFSGFKVPIKIKEHCECQKKFKYVQTRNIFLYLINARGRGEPWPMLTKSCCHTKEANWSKTHRKFPNSSGISLFGYIH